MSQIQFRVMTNSDRSSGILASGVIFITEIKDLLCRLEVSDSFILKQFTRMVCVISYTLIFYLKILCYICIIYITGVFASILSSSTSLSPILHCAIFLTYSLTQFSVLYFNLYSVLYYTQDFLHYFQIFPWIQIHLSS